jgi:6-phosphogluconolactonase (cycloisomerase 2 family)
MRIGKWARLALTASLFLGGCKGFWDPLPSTGTGTTGSTTLSSGPFYVINQGTRQLIAYNIVTGVLQTIGSAITLPGAPTCLAIAPNGKWLYVGTASGILLYDINSGGALTAGNNGTTISSDVVSALQVDSTNANLVGAWVQSTTAQIQSIPLNGTGTPSGVAAKTASVTSLTGASPAVHQLAITPDNAYVIVALGTAGTVIVPFASSGGVTAGNYTPQIKVLNNGGAALSVAVDPITTTNTSSRLLYIGETLATSTTSGGLRAIDYSTVGTGSPADITGSPFSISGAVAPNFIFPLPTADYVYVANGNGSTSAGNIAWYSITGSGSSTEFTFINTVSAGVQPIGLTEDNESNFLLAVATGGSTNAGDPDLEAYTISTGALTSVLTAKTGNDPVIATAIVAAP